MYQLYNIKFLADLQGWQPLCLPLPDAVCDSYKIWMIHEEGLRRIFYLLQKCCVLWNMISFMRCSNFGKYYNGIYISCNAVFHLTEYVLFHFCIVIYWAKFLYGQFISKLLVLFSSQQKQGRNFLKHDFTKSSTKLLLLHVVKFVHKWSKNFPSIIALGHRWSSLPHRAKRTNV